MLVALDGAQLDAVALLVLVDESLELVALGHHAVDAVAAASGVRVWVVVAVAVAVAVRLRERSMRDERVARHGRVCWQLRVLMLMMVMVMVMMMMMMRLWLLLQVNADLDGSRVEHGLLA